MERYSRNILLPEIGEEGQRKLLSSRALVIGAGGLGSAVLPFLTGAGVGHITIADPDVVSLSNLQRQLLYTEAEIGMPKTQAATRRLSEMNSSLAFTAVAEGFTPENAESLVRECDILIDCTDNFATRFLIDDTCAALGKPWVYGAIGGLHGQLSLLNGRAGRRYSHLHPDREAMLALPRVTAGVLGAVPGTIGALQAAEAIKFLTGMESPLDGCLFTLDFITMQSALLTF